MLSAEIIAIGSELLTPTKTDTNSLWLTEKLNEIGIEVKLKIIVGDDELRLKETIKDALSRSDIVITTGGMGPTEDDITRKISAEAIGRKLIFREDILASISKKFLKMNREMPEINKRQAFIIEDGDVLPNPNGSAPGMAVEIDNKYLIILPGPPRELKPMFENFVLPKLKQTAGEIFVKRKVLRVTGMGESAIDEIIAPVYTQYKNPQTSTLFNRSEVEIQLTAQGKNEDEADQMLKDLADKIVAKLGIAVFSVNGELMEEVVGRLLIESEKTLSVAESCTGGLIAQRLTDIPGSSKFFVEGVVAYANTAKIRTLNVPSDLIEKFGAVSAEVAEAMAKNLLEQSETNFAISVTGIAGPAGGIEEKPVGLVFIGYASQEEVKYIKLNLPGDRHLIRWRASQAALDFLRRKMIRMNS
ncbi:MAG: competence/damage-inducible protein A [Pyrinomonadaceae bacterium]